MNQRRWFRASEAFFSAILLIAGAGFLLAGTLPARAQSPYTAPLTNVGATSATQTVTVTLTTAGTLKKIDVLTQGAAGLDYAAAGSAGTCTIGTAYLVGDTCTVQFTFSPTYPGVRSGGVALSDVTGKLLGNSFLIGTGVGPQLFSPFDASTVPSSLSSAFSSPAGIAVDGSGNVYVADTANSKVKELKAVSGVVPPSPTIVTLGSGFSSPSGVAIDGSGNLYVADTGNNAVKELIAVSGVVPSNPTILTLGSGFSGPAGVAVDASGNVYVADSVHNAVKEIVAVNGVIPAGATPSTLSSSFTLPKGLAVDSSGNVYVADSSSFISEIVAVSGVIPASPTIKQLGSDFQLPSGVAVDGSGDVYVADSGNNAVKEIVAVGGTISSSPTILTLGSGFTSPGDVVVDASGDVYLVDTGNNAVKEMAQQTPTLTFPSTPVGTTSPTELSVTVGNSGNASLVFAIPASGQNPTVAANFSLSTSSTCPELNSTATSPSSLAPGTNCIYTLGFAPTQAGNISGSLIFIDNNGNVAGSSESVNLSGMATPGTLTVAVSSPSVVVGATSVTLSAMVSYGGVTPTGAVTFTVNGGSAITATCTGASSPRTCSASYNPSSLAVNTYPIVASVASDSSYNSASGNGTLTVKLGTPGLTLTSSTATTTVNGPVTFTVAITPNSGITPSGKVTFNAQIGGVTTPIAGCSAVSAVAGAGPTLKATCNTSALTVGAPTVYATIAADSNFNTFQSNNVYQTVTAATTTLTLSPPTSSTVGSSVTFTATLSSAAAFTPIVPGGTVSFTANGNAITGCTAVILNATTHAATCSTSALGAPADSIDATYSGDASFKTSTALAVSQVVNKNTPSSVVTTSVSVAVVNQTVTFVATITPNGASAGGILPSGSVTFTKGSSSGSAVCGPVVVVGNPSNGTASASCPVAFTNIFSATGIYANYSGDTNYATGAASSVQQSVLPAPTATTVTSNLLSVGVNQSVNLTATVTPAIIGAANGYSGTATPQTGMVKFSDSLTSGTFCVSSLTAGVVPTCSHTFTSAGDHKITAAYTSSDPNFNSSTIANSVTVVVGTSSTAVAFTSPAASVSTTDQVVTFAATITPPTSGSTTPTGTITFAYSLNGGVKTTICSSAVSTSAGVSSASCSGPLPSAGSYTITANYSGDSNFTAPSLAPSFVQTVTPTGLTLTAQPPSPQVDSSTTYSAMLSLPSTITDTAPGDSVPTGLITFTSDAGTSCTTSAVATTGSSIGASCALNLGTPGAHTITVSYGNDANFTAATITESVTVAQTSLTLSASLPALQVNAATTVSGQLSLPSSISDTGKGDSSPTGLITFTSNSGASCTTAAVATTGSTIGASCQLTPNTAGAQTVTISYSGDPNFSAVSVTKSITVAKAVPTIMLTSSSAANTSVATQTVTFTAVVTASSGTQPTNVPVSFTVQGGTACTVTQTVSGSTYTDTCVSTFPSSASGVETVTATYSGDSNYASATGSLTQTVQNFTFVSAPANLTLAQGSTNQTDPYSQMILLTATPQSGAFPNTMVACTVTPVTAGLSCAPGALASAAGNAMTAAVTISASSTVPTGTYMVQYTLSDTDVPALSHTASASLTIINQAPTVYVGSIGTTVGNFTASQSGACNPAVLATLSGTTYTTSTGRTFANVNIQCSGVTSSGTNSYTFTITAGNSTSAQLETGHGNSGIVLACLGGAPFLLMLGFVPASKKLRKLMLHSLAVVGLGVLLLQVTGCGGGGFTVPTGTRAVDGSYLIDIVNPQGATVAEVPLVIAN